MIRKHYVWLVWVLLCATSLAEVYAQPDTIWSRRADSIETFFVGAWGPFDHWWQHDTEQYFGGLGDMSRHRYIDLEDTLGLNAEIRKFWDYPTAKYPAPPEKVLGGKRGPFLDVLGIEPVQFYTAFDNAFYLRFEFERHEQQTAATEYLGFLERPGLTGRNVRREGATSPLFLIGTSRETDINALELGSDDDAGVFADSMWHPNIYLNQPLSHAWLAHPDRSRKMKLRIRVKVNETVTDTNDIVWIVRRTEKSTKGVVLVDHTDTITAGYQFKHTNVDFDTIDIPFIRDVSHVSQSVTDSTRRIEFSFFWPKQVSAVFDYMELLTAHIDTTDSEHDVQVGWQQFGTDCIAQEWASAFSGEDFLAPDPVELGKLISRVKRQYLGRVQYLRLGDEFPLAQGLPFKRIVKLLRDSTNGMIEVAPFTVDSGAGWFGQSIPNANEYNFEGARKGWVDTSLYADPKMIFHDPYCIDNLLPLPRRTGDIATLHQWERSFMPSIYGNEYTPDRYLKRMQYRALCMYLEANRRGRRWTERQGNNTKYGLCWQAGAHPELENNTMKFRSLRPPTGAEMKVTGHLAASCGSSGMLLYLLSNPGHGRSGPNGGVMLYDGTHDSMYYTTFIGNAHGRIWLGMKERYDSVRALIPVMRAYGTALLRAKRLGDWQASEMFFAPDNLPFVPMSLRSQDEAGRVDPFHPVNTTTPTVYTESWPLQPQVADTSNRTFVHVSVWLDTVGNKSDTLLYITNMRTDDSYQPGTNNVSTQDRRLITLQLKADHFIADVFDTTAAQTQDRGIIGDRCVNAGEKLKVSLLPGEGVLVRLKDAQCEPEPTTPADGIHFSSIPNPSFGHMSFSFKLPEDAPVTLTIHDVLGREVATVCKNEFLTAGWQTLWHSHSSLSDGSYYARLRFNDAEHVLMIVVLH